MNDFYTAYPKGVIPELTNLYLVTATNGHSENMHASSKDEASSLYSAQYPSRTIITVRLIEDF